MIKYHTPYVPEEPDDERDESMANEFGLPVDPNQKKWSNFKHVLALEEQKNVNRQLQRKAMIVVNVATLAMEAIEALYVSYPHGPLYMLNAINHAAPGKRARTGSALARALSPRTGVGKG